MRYYFPIDSKNLPHYFGCACIMPSKYFSNKSEDIQNKFEDFLLISNKMGTNETDCSLEIVLTKEEEDKLHPFLKSSDFFLLEMPLPITRIKSVNFLTSQQADQIVTIINLSSAFVPKFMVQLVENMDIADTSNLRLNPELKSTDWTQRIKNFDSLLGGFALMRLGGEEYMNYSENYFSTLSQFNVIIGNELTNSNIKFNNIYSDAFWGKDKFKTIFPYLHKNITEEDIYHIAKSENQKIVKNSLTGIIEIKYLEKSAYILAVLYTYGVGDELKKKKVDSLIINNFKDEYKNDKSEILSLCYGLNRGYSVFSNKYKISNKEKIVKFELNSQLDYYTIESLYQFSINGIAKSEEFPYLDNWCPKLKKIKKSNTYQILDQIVTEKNKPTVGSYEYLSQLLRSFSQKNFEDILKPLFEKLIDTIKNDIRIEVQQEMELQEKKIREDQEMKIRAEQEMRMRDMRLQQDQEMKIREMKIMEKAREDQEWKFKEALKEQTTSNVSFQLQAKELEIQEIQQKNEDLRIENENLRKNLELLEGSSKIRVIDVEDENKVIELNNRYSDLLKLVKEISKQSNVKIVKDLIKKFYLKHMSQDEDWFN